MLLAERKVPLSLSPLAISSSLPFRGFPHTMSRGVVSRRPVRAGVDPRCGARCLSSKCCHVGTHHAAARRFPPHCPAAQAGRSPPTALRMSMSTAALVRELPTKALIGTLLAGRRQYDGAAASIAGGCAVAPKKEQWPATAAARVRGPFDGFPLVSGGTDSRLDVAALIEHDLDDPLTPDGLPRYAKPTNWA